MASVPGRRLFWVSVLAALLLGGGIALAVDPIGTVGSARQGYEAIPARATPAGLDRAVDRTLDRLIEGAVGNNPGLLLQVPLQLDSPVPRGQWNGTAALPVTWDTFGTDKLRYLVLRTGNETEGSLAGRGAEVAGGGTQLAVSAGEWWVHVQPSYGGQRGPVASLGPFLIDPTPPPAPSLPAALASTQYQYTVSWTPVTDRSGVPRYLVERSLNGGTSFQPYRLVDEARFTDRNVVNGEYRFRVRAINGAGLESEPSTVLVVTVNAASDLTPPAPGDFDYGIHAVYDSLLYVWDISDPGKYMTVAQARAALGETLYAQYTGTGWGVEIDNATLRAEVLGQVGGEKNTLRIATRLFEWLYNATDYDFDKFNDPTAATFQRAGETLDRGLGICGDLTSLYVTALRVAGVPARPVHGYLLNDRPDGAGLSIGGFHMWAEVFVGGPDPVGGGWVPVDVSGVTGEFEPEKLDIYFGVYNPDYLQLGSQEDLGPASFDEGDDWESKLRAKWNVWATLNWAYKQPRNSPLPPPDVGFETGEAVEEIEAEEGRLWFDGEHRRIVTQGDRDRPPAPGFERYFPVKARSVRTLDYGANVTYSDERITELNLYLKFPDFPAASQSALFTAYQVLPNGAHIPVEVREAGAQYPLLYGDGFLHWRICVQQTTC